jgi:hypothetical protein
MTQVSDKSLARGWSSTALLMLSYVQFTVEAGRYAHPVLPCLMLLSIACLRQVWWELYGCVGGAVPHTAV